MASTYDKLPHYVFHRHIVSDFEVLATKFKMDSSLTKSSIRSFLEFTKDLAINMLFPYSILKNLSAKLMITGLSLKYRTIHYTICKVIFLRVINFMQIKKGELSFVRAIKNQLDFNMPFLIIKYPYDCVRRKNIGFLLHKMILTHILIDLNATKEDSSKSHLQKIITLGHYYYSC